MPDPVPEQRKLAAIMFTDMVGYSALAHRNEAGAIELLEEHRQVVRSVLSRHSGREVKTTGDGFLIEFPSALAAVQGAVEIQQALHARNQAAPPDRQVNIRIGIHLGDVVPNQGDIHGDGVNIAARLEPLAAPGGICISSAVWEQVHNKVSQPLALLGPAELKNIELPVVVHRVVMPWESSTQPAQSPTRRAAWIAGAVALVLLAVGLAGVSWWRQNQRPPPNGEPPNTILFKTGFEAPACQPGLLDGQDGWIARGGLASGAAAVIASRSGQLVSISGTGLAHVSSNLWSAWFIHPLTTSPPVTNMLRLSVEAEFEFNPGSGSLGNGFLASMLMLSDDQATAFAAVGVNKLGAPFGQNFSHPNEHVSTNQGTNAVHLIRAEYDFARRVATFQVNGRTFGEVPFNPKSGARPETVSVVLQSDHAVDATLRVDNVTVRALSDDTTWLLARG